MNGPEAGQGLKRCSKCGAWKTLEAFAVDRPRANGKHNADGRHSHCRECQRTAARAWAATHRERARENARRHYAENPETYLKNHLRWCRTNPAARPAHACVAVALRIGRVVMPDTCDRCGAAGLVFAHHEDYARPLWLESLCHSCHRSTHGHNSKFADKGTGHVHCEPVARLRSPDRMGPGGDAPDRPGIRAGGQSVALPSVLGAEGAGNSVQGYERVPPDALLARAAGGHRAGPAAAETAPGGVAGAGTRAEVEATGQKAEAATSGFLLRLTADLLPPRRPLGCETRMAVASWRPQPGPPGRVSRAAHCLGYACGTVPQFTGPPRCPPGAAAPFIAEEHTMSPTALRALTSAREAAGTAWDAAALAWECLIVAVLTWWDTRDCPAEDGEDGFYDA